MNKIKILDCTLRDGGYINNWFFGKDAIYDITRKLEKSNTDIIELGFIRDELYNEDRAIFSTIEEATALVGERVEGREYAVMTEISRPYPLEKLAPRTPESPEIIRVIVWKRLMQESFEYCKGIVEKGYKLCVQPARVSQYSDEEFVAMVELFNELDPLAVYVVDSWGTMYQDELLHYLHLADKHLKQGISLGYHGHNNMMQAFDVACAFCEQKIDRDLIVDSSVYGIGRGAGNLNSELFAKYMNEKIGATYDLHSFVDIFDLYIKDIHAKHKWGYSIPFYISAKYNCNPDFASYFEAQNCSPSFIEELISSMSEDERIIFNKDKADDILYNARKKISLCIVVPVLNSAEKISFWLESQARAYYRYGVDLVFVDSSDNFISKELIENFGLKNVHYERYDEIPLYQETLDEKAYYCFKLVADKYDAIWPCRDRSLPIIENIYDDFVDAFSQKRDFIVFYPHGSTETTRKVYTDCAKLMVENFGDMTSLGSVIYFSKIAQSIVKNHKVEKDVNLGLWLPVALFHEIAGRQFSALYIRSTSFTYTAYTSGSFWLKNKSALPLWTDKWPKIIANLPSEYDEIQNALLTFKNWALPPFVDWILFQARSYGDFSFKAVMQKREILQRIAGSDFKQIIYVSLLSEQLAEKLAKRNKRGAVRLKKFFIRNIILPFILLFVHKSAYNPLIKDNFSNAKIVTDYDVHQDCFALTKHTPTRLLYEEEGKTQSPFITVFIPTYKRPAFLKEAIESVLNQKAVDFEWDIIVVDNEPYDGEVNETEKLVRSFKNNKISYYRNEASLRVADNFNRGFTLAKAPWVMMLHDDDLLVSNTLEKMGNNIRFLSEQKGQDLGAIAVQYYQFDFDSQQPSAHVQKLEELHTALCNGKPSYKFYRLTREHVLATGHIGGALPSAGATYNKKAVIETGGFNEDLGISADLILYYQLEKKYRVYQTQERYGFYRWGMNSMAEHKNTVKVIQDNFNFREYIFSKNIFTKTFGFLFRSSLYYKFTSAAIAQTNNSTVRLADFAEFANIYNTRPSQLSYWVWRKVVHNSYRIKKSIEMRILRHKAKKFFKNEK